MIKEIKLDNVATYTKENGILIKPTKINYFYGNNGSGKSTLANVLKDSKNEKFEECNILWENSLEIDTLVYNKDFVQENFSQKKDIKGIFTLGKESVDIKEKIEHLKEEKEKQSQKLNKTKESLDKINQEKDKIKSEAIEFCWRQKTKYYNKCKEAFTGVANSKNKFFERLLGNYNNLELKEVEEGEVLNRYNNLYSKELKKYKYLPILDSKDIRNVEESSLLDKVIIGKEDLEIGKLISKLSNSDWVKQGLSFVENSDNKCPFCQQSLNSSIVVNIEEYFDESYKSDCEKLNSFKKEYERYLDSLIRVLDSIDYESYNINNIDELKNKIDEIKLIYKSNIRLIQEKIDMPSKKIEIESLYKKVNVIILLIDEINKKLKVNNNRIDNLTKEKDKVINDIWIMMINNLKEDIKRYSKEIENKNKAISGLKNKISELEKDIKKKEKNISEESSKIANVESVVTDINKILKSFGFNSFKLNLGEEEGTYKIVRSDGTNAKDTLSEGEYRFITFLYFYYLVNGSNEPTNIRKDKILVIDDPISSLDSNTLFIISTLIKNLIDECINNKNDIKQVFILTHNIYFYKEVTYKGSRNNPSPSIESYWIIQKLNSISNIKRFENNPILTTYETLWRTLDNIDGVSNRNNVLDISTGLNAMRRILEHYFNVLCGYNYEECINKFDGEDKLICKSLLSYINDGSHFISDDYVLCYEDLGNYKRVFKLIFEKMGHIKHYEAMSSSERAWRYKEN